MKNKKKQNMMIRIGRFRLLLFSIFVTFVVSGCVTNEWAEKEQHEKDVIAAYVKDNNISEEQKTENGIYFIEQVAGTGLVPKENDFVIINYTGRYLEGNRIHETSFDSLKNDWEGAETYQYFVYGPLKFEYGFSITGINEGLSMMKEGGKARLLIPSDKAFYDFNPMIYDIELLKVISEPEVYDSTVMMNYVTQNAWDPETTYDTIQGIFIKETFTPDPGDEHTFQARDTLFFNFTGKILDGYEPVVSERVFDTNLDDGKPIKYVYGGNSFTSGTMLGFPAGLKSALDTLRQGTKATFILPWDKAFGDKGLINSTYGYIIVPKYQTVVYDIEVLDLQSPEP